ncbi:hypothetical protein [Phenylobacterium sp.]|uniref:hypothetical protein n=1 Tax=Phenylobacterium sp. TaxID=1871053 RepID=UPI003561A119
MAHRIWLERLWLAAAACVALAILGFYASRLLMPLPIYAADEAAYLIRAIYPDPVVALNPAVAPLNNGVHLSVIRAVYRLGAPFIVGDRLVNAAAYLGGLLLLWRASAARLPRGDQFALLLIAVGFPYYRFAFSNLAEGLFVGVLAMFCVATGRWYRSRPSAHALLAGLLGATLVLVKPNGMASIAALAVLAILEAAASGQWRRLPLRALIFGVAFFVAGNLIQIAAEAPAAHPLAFFVGDLYGGQLASQMPPGALRFGLLTLDSMISAMALLAGPPIVAGLTDLWSRRRKARGPFEANGRDLVFVLLVLSLLATLAMVAIFAMKISSTHGETERLWGRYFEFLAPMIWLAAAPALAQPMTPRVRLACAAVALAGLAGLIVSFQAGIVLFPWDASILTAFFHPDPVRAPVYFAFPYRALAVAASLAAAAAMALQIRPLQAGLGLILALGALSTWLDHVWVGPMAAQRDALERDIRALQPQLPVTGEIVLLAPDENDGHLGFLRLDARPRVLLGPPGQLPLGILTDVKAVVAAGPEAPPGGPWIQTYKGAELSLYRRP